MKKILLGFVTLVLVTASLFLAGCEKEKDFQKPVAQAAAEFYSTEEFSFLFDSQTSITYNTAIDNQILLATDADYATLSTLYERSLKNFTIMFSTFHQNLALAPQSDADNVRNAYKHLEGQIANMKNATEEFLARKQTFVNFVKTQPLSASSKAELKVFKNHFKKYLFQARSFFEAFENVYLTGFVTYPTQNAQTVMPGVQTLLPTVWIGRLTAVNLEFFFDGDSDIEHKNSLNILNKVDNIKQAMANPSKTEEELTAQQLNLFLTFEKTFNAETNQFKNSLANFDYEKYHQSSNQTQFLDEGNNRLFFNKINKYISTYTNMFVSFIVENIL